jgi:putative effector of murein hydrolase
MSVVDIFEQPLMALFITIASFLAAQWFQKKMGVHSLLNPVVVSIVLVVVYILAFDIAYHDYLQHVNLIHALLGPATVALAIPLYNQLPVIRQSMVAIGSAVVVGAAVAAGVGYYLAVLMGAGEDMQLAITTKSLTTAIAIGVAEKIQADPALAVFFVFTTGMIGSVIASFVFRVGRITDDRAIGLALGVTCHGLGVARAFQHSHKAGAFSALGMSLMGLVSGVAIPLIVIMFL